MYNIKDVATCDWPASILYVCVTSAAMCELLLECGEACGVMWFAETIVG